MEYKAIGKEIEQKWQDKNQFVGLQRRANVLRETILQGKSDVSDTDHEDDKSWDQDSSTMSLGVSCTVSVSQRQGFNELPQDSKQLGSCGALRSKGRDATWKQVPSVFPESGSSPGCCRTTERGRIASEEDCIQQHVLGGRVCSPGIREGSTSKFVGKSCLLDVEVRDYNCDDGGCARKSRDEMVSNTKELLDEKSDNGDNIPDSFDNWSIADSNGQNGNCENLRNGKDKPSKGRLSVMEPKIVRAICINDDDDVDPQFPYF